MKKHRFGFTLVEVALFLAITGAIFVGIVAGTQNTIWHQRFNDSVQNFAEFLRSIYSQVSNPQSIGAGNTEKAIYGKLVVFGESYGLDGEPIAPTDTQKVFVYDVVGNVIDNGSGNAINMLTDLNANVIIRKEVNGENVVEAAGIVESYSPRWAAGIQRTDKTEAFKGSILVVRHPRSGTINTFVSSDVVEVNKTVRDAGIATRTGSFNWDNYSSLLMDFLKSNKFGTAEIDFCVNPYGNEEVTDDEAELARITRTDVRLVKNARNASGVEIIDLDGEGNRCRHGE